MLFRTTRTAIVFALSMLGMLSASSVEAQLSEHRIYGVRGEGHIGVGWASRLTFGAQAEIPIARNGLIRGTTDELALVPALDVLFLDVYDFRRRGDQIGLDRRWGVAPSLALQWNFYFDDSDWSFFPEFGAAVIWVRREDRVDDTFVDPVIGGGARYHFSRRNAITMRFNWPHGFRFGITF